MASLKAVVAKTTSAPWTAALSEAASSTSLGMISMSFATSAYLDGLLGSRDVPRIFQAGSLRKAEATELPWLRLSVLIFSEGGEGNWLDCRLFQL